MNRLGQKRKRRLERLRQKSEERRRMHQLMREHAADILDSPNFLRTKNYIQHGSVPVHQHCIDVATHSLILSKRLRVSCNERELIRGALLHDYFLYDWHDRNREDYQYLHGFYHPGIALRNADKEYELTMRERDIIKKHMWPLTVVPPRCREAWIVTTADKYCSLLETLKLRKGTDRAKMGLAR